jgi:lipopolysaccharide/colanic/teichoic acid biosynthesis glycosyltransferase
MKRVIDVILSVIAFPFFIIILICVVPLIYFDDKGPIFYNADRLGKNAKVFKMYKFRSMYVDAPDIRLADGSTYNGKNDSRVTRVGRFLRNTSLDEVPQILNVINGTMSLIGPRPDTPKGLHRYPEEEKYYFQVKPGITGYNQAYYRNSVDGHQKAINDAYYAKNISFIFDVKIFLRTIYSVVFRKGIYKQ